MPPDRGAAGCADPAAPSALARVPSCSPVVRHPVAVAVPLRLRVAPPGVTVAAAVCKRNCASCSESLLSESSAWDRLGRPRAFSHASSRTAMAGLSRWSTSWSLAARASASSSLRLNLASRLAAVAAPPCSPASVPTARLSVTNSLPDIPFARSRERQPLLRPPGTYTGHLRDKHQRRLRLASDAPAPAGARPRPSRTGAFCQGKH